jgi:hypothetical protein
MAITLEVSFGADSRATVTGNSIKEAIERAQLFNEIPSTCPLCKTGTRLQYREAKGHKFYEVRCDGTFVQGAYEFHTSQLGVFKDDDRELYYKQGVPWNVVRPKTITAVDNPLPEFEPEPRRAQPKPQQHKAAPKQAPRQDTDASKPPKNIERLNAVMEQARVVGITTNDLRKHIGLERLPEATDAQLTKLETFVADNS